MSHHNTNSESATPFPLGRGDESASGNILVGAVQPGPLVVLEAIHGWPVKDDVSSMEHSTFSLSKNRDMRIRVYSCTGRSIRIIPPAVGAATVFDKDILICCTSQIVRGHDAGIKVSRRVHVDVYPFLLGTRRSTGDAAYERAIDTCQRSKDTTTETNVKTNEKERLEGFDLIKDYRVTTWAENDEGTLELELAISKWLYRAAIDFDILMSHLNYFSFGQTPERCSYELARKHCGDKAWWEINLPLPLEKADSLQTLRHFKQEIKEIVERDLLPDYRVFLGESVRPNKLVIMTHDNTKLVCGANKANKLSWISYFLQKKLV